MTTAAGQKDDRRGDTSQEMQLALEAENNLTPTGKGSRQSSAQNLKKPGSRSWPQPLQRMQAASTLTSTL